MGFFARIFGVARAHEDLRGQLADAHEDPVVAANMREACDELSGASGEFGSLTNPIPVNGPIGEIAYLNALRSTTGRGFLFHRTGTSKSPVSDLPVDRFELLGNDGLEWRILYFSKFHPAEARNALRGSRLQNGLLRTWRKSFKSFQLPEPCAR